MSNDKLLSEMDRAVLAMPPELAFSDDLARFQYYGRVQALIARIDAHEAEKQAGPVGAVLVNKETREGVAFYSADILPDPGELKDRFELVKVYAAPPSESDKEDAESYRWLLTQFRAMSLDMGGNHCWVLARSGSLRGPTIDDAIRAARAKEEQQLNKGKGGDTVGS